MEDSLETHDRKLRPSVRNRRSSKGCENKNKRQMDFYFSYITFKSRYEPTNYCPKLPIIWFTHVNNEIRMTYDGPS